MTLIRANKCSLNNGNSSGCFSRGDFCNDIGIADDGTAARTDLLVVIVDDPEGRTVEVGTCVGSGLIGRLGLIAPARSRISDAGKALHWFAIRQTRC